MKICPKCNKTYTDEFLNFCLADGELLQKLDENDAPPTIRFDSPRDTIESHAPPTFQPQNETQRWTPPTPPVFNQSQPVQQYGDGGAFTGYVSEENTLATVSLILGIVGFVLVCCYLGIPIGLAAGITGFLAFRKSNEIASGNGKGMAIAGMILGGLSILSSLVMVILVIISNV
ncbi:MAG: DUF4190 domain-containing protein [Pyrinomonadaceae bacterium]